MRHGAFQRRAEKEAIDLWQNDGRCAGPMSCSDHEATRFIQPAKSMATNASHHATGHHPFTSCAAACPPPVDSADPMGAWRFIVDDPTQKPPLWRRGDVMWCLMCGGLFCEEGRRERFAIGRPGSDRLSRVLRRSIIGAGAFHGRVRNGIGCGRPAVTTRSANRKRLESFERAFARP